MKSAYELAMERLQAEDPASTQELTDEQRENLAEIDRKYRARIAEREVFLQGQISQARQQRNQTDIQQLERQLRDERIRLEEERDQAKERVRKGKG